MRFCSPSARIYFEITKLISLVGTIVQTVLNPHLKLVQTVKNAVQTVRCFSYFPCRVGFKVVQTVQSVICHRVFNNTRHTHFFLSKRIPLLLFALVGSWLISLVALFQCYRVTVNMKCGSSHLFLLLVL